MNDSSKNDPKNKSQSNRFTELQAKSLTYNEAYVKKYIDNIARGVIKSFIEKKSDAGFCEVGCGNGGSAVAVLNRISELIATEKIELPNNAKLNIVLTDISSAQMANAQKAIAVNKELIENLHSLGLKVNINFQENDVTKNGASEELITLNDNKKFDVVSYKWIAHEMGQDQSKLAKASARLLNGNGTLIAANMFNIYDKHIDTAKIANIRNAMKHAVNNKFYQEKDEYKHDLVNIDPNVLGGDFKGHVKAYLNTKQPLHLMYHAYDFARAFIKPQSRDGTPGIDTYFFPTTSYANQQGIISERGDVKEIKEDYIKNNIQDVNFVYRIEKYMPSRLGNKEAICRVLDIDIADLEELFRNNKKELAGKISEVFFAHQNGIQPSEMIGTNDEILQTMNESENLDAFLQNLGERRWDYTINQSAYVIKQMRHIVQEELDILQDKDVLSTQENSYKQYLETILQRSVETQNNVESYDDFNTIIETTQFGKKEAEKTQLTQNFLTENGEKGTQSVFSGELSAINLYRMVANQGYTDLSALTGIHSAASYNPHVKTDILQPVKYSSWTEYEQAQRSRTNESIQM